MKGKTSKTHEEGKILTIETPESERKDDGYGRRDFIKLMGANAAAFASLPLIESVLGKLSTAQGAEKARKSKEGYADVYAFKCGVLKTQTQYMLKDTRIGTPMDIPVTFFLIRHGNDWVAFDTGNNAMVAKDPVGYWSEPVVKAYTPVMKDYEEFKFQIDKAFGIKPKDIKYVVLSHGHLDHAGAIDNFVGTRTPFFLQKKELDQIQLELANFKKTGKKTAYIPGDFAKMNKLKIKTIDGIYDIFGDKSVVLFPTPGHTPGHQSIMVRTSDGQVLFLAADAAYTQENIYEAIPPGLAWDVPQSSQALCMFKLMELAAPSNKVIVSHDPRYWKNRKVAPALLDA
ncbi:MAG TPA: N-acyl homoserine lactonase family protein [Spirochaetes bacterium]|nr:N-acyl homoserine lactonase family protein [Spirochaetota bacterium]